MKMMIIIGLILLFHFINASLVALNIYFCSCDFFSLLAMVIYSTIYAFITNFSLKLTVDENEQLTALFNLILISVRIITTWIYCCYTLKTLSICLFTVYAPLVVIIAALQCYCLQQHINNFDLEQVYRLFIPFFI